MDRHVVARGRSRNVLEAQPARRLHQGHGRVRSDRARQLTIRLVGGSKKRNLPPKIDVLFIYRRDAADPVVTSRHSNVELKKFAPHMNQLARLGGTDGLLKFTNERLIELNLVSWYVHEDNSEGKPAPILLVFNSLVNRHEDINPPLRRRQERSVVEGPPASSSLPLARFEQRGPARPGAGGRPHIRLGGYALDEVLSRQIQESDRLFAGDSWKAYQEVVDCVAGFQVVHERLHWDTSTGKTGGAVQDVRVDRDDLAQASPLLGCHTPTISDLASCCNRPSLAGSAAAPVMEKAAAGSGGSFDA